MAMRFADFKKNHRLETAKKIEIAVLAYNRVRDYLLEFDVGEDLYFTRFQSAIDLIDEATCRLKCIVPIMVVDNKLILAYHSRAEKSTMKFAQTIKPEVLLIKAKKKLCEEIIDLTYQS